VVLFSFAVPVYLSLEHCHDGLSALKMAIQPIFPVTAWL
jgi:hypothetical protein